jgi:nucleotide-binding universal stress UspA family protein
MLAPRAILYAADFSEGSRYAFEVAVALASNFGSRLAVLHVRPGVASCRGASLASFEADEQEVILEQLVSYRPRGIRLSISHHLSQGDPAAEIVRMGRKLACDLIVLGSHGNTGLDEVRLGNVAAKVFQCAGCPVLLVRGRPPSSIDGSVHERPAQLTG